MAMIAELVEYLARAVVDHPDDVKVTEERDGNHVRVWLDVHEDDRGKVIGRGGRIATSIRQLAKVAAVKEDVRLDLEIAR